MEIIIGAVALGLLWAITTIGAFISYKVLDIADLSLEGSIVLGASVASMIIVSGGNPYLATVAAMFAGMIAGLVTGVLHTKLKIPALLSGILCMTALYSINIRVMGKANQSLLRMDTVFTYVMDMGLAKNMSTIINGVACAVLVMLGIYWFFGTEIGSAIRATGNNINMAKAQGVNTDTAIILGLVLSNGLIGLSGGLIAQYQGFSDVYMGVGSIVIALASVIIGEVLFGTTTFKRNLISLVLGAVLYRIIIALVMEAGMPSTDLKLFTAIFVVIALCLPSIKLWFASRKKAESNWRNL